MFLQFQTARGEVFAVNSGQGSCFFPLKKGSCLVLVDGSSWDVTLSYEQLCSLFSTSDLKL